VDRPDCAGDSDHCQGVEQVGPDHVAAGAKRDDEQDRQLCAQNAGSHGYRSQDCGDAENQRDIGDVRAPGVPQRNAERQCNSEKYHGEL
jgi:hypothetical protein